MFGFLGKLFGSQKSLEKVVDGTISAFDKMFDTDQEKREGRAAFNITMGNMVIKWQEATQGQNLARRLLALIIAGIWVFQYFMSVVLNVSAVWVGASFTPTTLITVSPTATALQASAQAISSNATEMNGAMMLILGFYFAAPHLAAIVPAAMKKFGGSSEQSK